MGIQFTGKDYFLSPDSHSKVVLYGKEFKSVTAAVLSFKNKDKRNKFTKLLPKRAKELADTLEADEDWEERREHYIYKATLSKFENNKFLRKKFLEYDIEQLPKDSEEYIIFNLVRKALIQKQLLKENDDADSFIKSLIKGILPLN